MFADNGIGVKGAKAIGAAITGSVSLSSLDLSGKLHVFAEPRVSSVDIFVHVDLASGAVVVLLRIVLSCDSTNTSFLYCAW